MIDKLVKNWHIIVLVVGLVISLGTQYFHLSDHDAEFAQAALDAVSTVVAEETADE